MVQNIFRALITDIHHVDTDIQINVLLSGPLFVSRINNTPISNYIYCKRRYTTSKQVWIPGDFLQILALSCFYFINVFFQTLT